MYKVQSRTHRQTREHPCSSSRTLAVARQLPYIWSGWLPKPLTGEDFCEWAIWFKAHYQAWARQRSDFDQTQWLLNHTALLNEHKQLWIQRGYETRIEAQNAFRLRGHPATLAGRPDLLVLDKDRILIADVKGHRRYNLPPRTAEQHAAASRHNIVRYNVAAIRRQQREIHVIHRLRNRSPRFRLHH